MKLALNLSSICVTAIGGVVGGITLNPMVIDSLAGVGALIQGYVTKSDLPTRTKSIWFAYTSYKKTLTHIRSHLRGHPDDDVRRWTVL